VLHSRPGFIAIRNLALKTPNVRSISFRTDF
jgi:hypothetical protein